MKFTRLQYAKVVYQNFHVPKKFHGASRIIGGTECRKLAKSFDIGCRLTCGFEAIYQRAKSERASNVKTRMGDTNSNIASKVFYSDTHKQEQDICTIIDSILEDTYVDHREKAKTDNDINDNNESFSETKRSRNLLEAFVKICDKTPGDSDSWMYLSPEELDLEMESRVKKIQKENMKSPTDTSNISASTSALDSIIDDKYSKNNMKNEKDSKNKNMEENPSSDHLMEMLLGMKSFLGTKSGPDGIEDIQKSTSHIKSDNSNQTKNADTSIKTIYKNENEGVSVVTDTLISTSGIDKKTKLIGTTENTCDDDTPLEFDFDFDKFKDILKNFGENNDESETSNQPSNPLLDPSSNPLGDYFYERDLEELSSDDDSDYDSDDEVDYDKKSSRIEPVQYERNKQNLDDAVIISKENDNKVVENNISLAIIGMKNIKIDTKPSKDPRIGMRPKCDDRAKYDSTVESLRPSSTIKVSVAGSDVNASSTGDCAGVNTNFNNLNPQGIHDNIQTTMHFSLNSNTNSIDKRNNMHDKIAKDSKNNNDNSIARKDNDDDNDDDDGTDSFYDESETDSDDEIEMRPTARTNHGSATTSSQNNPDNLISHEEEGGRIDEDDDEINEGKYFEEYEVRDTNTINHFDISVCEL